MGHFFFSQTTSRDPPRRFLMTLPRSSSDLLQKKCTALGIKAIQDSKNPCLPRSAVTLPASLKLAPVKVLALSTDLRVPPVWTQ